MLVFLYDVINYDVINVKNFREILLLNSGYSSGNIEKILERLVYSRLYNFLEMNSVLCDLQFGFDENNRHLPSFDSI